MTDHAHTDSPTSNRVLTEQRDAARAELDAERQKHADLRVVVLEMMQAANAEMQAILDGVEALQRQTGAALGMLSDKVIAMQAEIDKLNVAIQAKP